MCKTITDLDNSILSVTDLSDAYMCDQIIIWTNADILSIRT